MKSIFSSIQSRYILIALGAVFLWLVSCNEYSVKQSDTSSMSEDTTAAILNDTSNMAKGSSSQSSDVESSKDHEIKRNPASIDSALTPPLSNDSAVNSKSKSRKAVFGYSFFRNIKQDETRNVNAYVSIIDAVSEVIDTLKQINATDIPERKNDTATILTKNIFVFKALNVHLLNAADSDFIIKSFSDSRQLIDSTEGNSWTWAVTPTTSKKHARLILNIIAEKPDGSREPFNTINIPIDIQLNKDINRTLWQWMMKNPEKVLTIILIPLIIFFWKQITGLFKKKDPEKKN